MAVTGAPRTYDTPPDVTAGVVADLLRATRHFIPYLRVIRATSGLYGRPWLVCAPRGVVIYDGAAPAALRREYLCAAVHELWMQRHLAGLDEHQHIRRHLNAVS